MPRQVMQLRGYAVEPDRAGKPRSGLFDARQPRSNSHPALPLSTEDIGLLSRLAEALIGTLVEAESLTQDGAIGGEKRNV